MTAHLSRKALCFALFSLMAVDVVAESMAQSKPHGVAAEHIVDHHDPIVVDPQLTLRQLLQQTVDQYPDRLVNQALLDEAQALRERGESWLAGSTSLQLNYENDQPAANSGYREASAEIQFTTWFWGQRAAAQAVADGAEKSAVKQSEVVALEVSRLLREALWDMADAEMAYQHAKYALDVSAQLLNKVEKQVEFGDLARADLLLAQSEHLQLKSQLTKAEAEWMHSRKGYASLTQSTHIPADYRETLSTIDSVQSSHPLLEAANALLERKQAAIEWARTTDTVNQPKVIVGARSSRDQRGSLDNQSVGVGVVIPFGHGTYDAPEIAAANLEFNQVKAQREHLYRALEKGLHEARHALEVTEKERLIADEMKAIAEKHLKMSELSFAAGEINLIDLLKIQARTMEAIRYAKQQEVKYQRDIAFYNQAVGVMP